MIKPVSFLADLVRRMTLDEKIGQLTMRGPVPPHAPPVDLPEGVRRGVVGNVLNVTGRSELDQLQTIARNESRLGIPILTCLDVLHGYRNIFPVPLAEVSTFDPDLWERTAAVAAAEARSEGIVLTFAPMLDVCRDPRWGRMSEGPGEDPWLASRYATAKVNGYQGASGSRLAGPTGLAATAKHFAAYGAVTAGREYASVDVSARTLDEVYLPPFRSAVDAGVAAVMPAFVDLAGEPMTCSRLLRDVLRNEWGFDGVIVSDYGAVAELVGHGVADDLANAAALALLAGVDIDMMSPAYEAGLPVALARGLVALPDIDAAVLRVLELKERLGLFAPATAPPLAVIDGVSALDLARDAARRSFVLLQDEGEILPLRQEGGPLALVDLWLTPPDMLGPWSAIGEAGDAADLGRALADAFPLRQTTVVGRNSVATGETPLASLVSSDTIVLRLGETAVMSGEGASRAFPNIPDEQINLANRILDLGRPTVVLLNCGRPLVAPTLLETKAAVLVCWFPGSAGAAAVCDVLSGRAEPEGRLPVSWPAAIGQIPVHYASRPVARPENPGDRFTSRYIDVSAAPRFWFGHGLGFSRFALESLRVVPERVGPGDCFRLLARVRNVGTRRARTVVFVFIRDRTARVARPLRELRGMIPVALEPGGVADVELKLTAAELAPLGGPSAGLPEAGDFDVLAGFSAEPSGLAEARLSVREQPFGDSHGSGEHDDDA